MSSQTVTSGSGHSICKFEQDCLVDDCSRAKIILMHLYRDILPNSSPAAPASGERIDCPFIRCCSKFTTYQERIEHMRTCGFFDGGEYKCPDCDKYECFSHSKASCSLIRERERKEGMLKRLSSSIERRLSGRSSRGSSLASSGKKTARQPETVSYPCRWEDQEPVIPSHPQEMPNPRQLDQLEEKRAELLTNSGPQAALPGDGSVACNDHHQPEVAKPRQQTYAAPTSNFSEKVVVSTAPVQAPVAINPTHEWNLHSSCTSSWAPCSSGSDCPVSALSSFSESQTGLGEASRQQSMMMMTMEPERMCASPSPMDSSIVPSELVPQPRLPEMPGNSEFINISELAGSSIPDYGSGFYQEEQMHMPTSSYSGAQAGNTHHHQPAVAEGGMANYSPPPPYCLFLGGAAQAQAQAQAQFGQESFAQPVSSIPTPSRTVSEDSTAPSFDSGYGTDHHRASHHDMQVPLPRTLSPMSPQNSLPATYPSGCCSSESSPAAAAATDDILRCPHCDWKPNPIYKPENFRPHMKRHIKTHSGTRLPCPVEGCDKTRSRSDNLRKHVREDHPECDEEDVLGPINRGTRDPGRAISKRRKIGAEGRDTNNFGGFRGEY